MSRPQPAEYDAYYEKYVSLVPEDEVITALAAQPDELEQLFRGVPEEKGTFAYAEGKWTVKESLSHIIDGERMFAYRALRIARGDKTPIEGFEQDGYIENSHANRRSIAELLGEFRLLREANVLFFRNLEPGDWLREGTANNVSISVRSLAWVMAGHVRHHIALFQERYLAKS
jgi:Methionine synthase I, cobalamin-binding domain